MSGKFKFKREIRLTLITVTIVTGQRVHALVATSVDLNLSAFVNVAMCRFVRIVSAVRNLVTHQMHVDAVAVIAHKLSFRARRVALLTVHLV
jgi:hypothetical protein